MEEGEIPENVEARDEINVEEGTNNEMLEIVDLHTDPERNSKRLIKTYTWKQLQTMQGGKDSIVKQVVSTRGLTRNKSQQSQSPDEVEVGALDATKKRGSRLNREAREIESYSNKNLGNHPLITTSFKNA